MSTTMEDRLAAALRARADQVQPEHLRPFDGPVVPLRSHRRRRTAVLAGVAAAACAAAVAGPLLLSTPQGGAPQPVAPTEPAPTASIGPRIGQVLDADVDGDGRTDTVRLHEAPGRGHVLVASLASADRHVLEIPGAEDGVPFRAGDLGGGPGDEIFVPLSGDPSVLPAVFTWVEGEGVVQATYDDAPRAWPEDDPERRWSVDLGAPVLITWHEAPPEGEKLWFWEWRVDDRGVLRPGPRVQGCAVVADMPFPCEWAPDPTQAADGMGQGAHGRGPTSPLPALMPAVENHYLVDERYAYGRDFLGPESTDWAQLQGDFGEPGDSVEKGQVELVVTVDGIEHRAPVPAGQSPWLVPHLLAVDGDTPVFVLAQSGGDLTVNRVFAFRDGELVEVESRKRGNAFLGSGVVYYRGELTEQRTWVTENGELFTSVLLDHSERRHQLWQWDLGRTMSSFDLGEACIDWEAGTYRRC